MSLQVRWGVKGPPTCPTSRAGDGALQIRKRERKQQHLLSHARTLFLLGGLLFQLSCKATVAGGEGNTLVNGAPPLGVVQQQAFSGCFDPVAGTGLVNAVTLLAQGGTPPGGYTWKVSAGSALPPGTTVDSDTGIFRGDGSALAVGSYTFSMDVTDGSNTASAPFSFNVDSAASEGGTCQGAPFEQNSVSGYTPPPGAVKGDYGTSLSVTVGGGSGAAVLPLVWSLASGTLPPGMTIDPARGVVSGVSPVSASGQQFTFTVTVTDAKGRVAVCPNQGVCPSYVIKVF